MDILDRGASLAQGFAAAYQDNIIPALAAWSAKGTGCALITLVGVDGNAPRAEGAQMAVSEAGQWAGYISGGCLEQAIALEAVEAIKAGKPRLLRYGKGSPYFDIRLPCGSGLDIFIQPMRDRLLIQDMNGRLERREPFALQIDLSTGSGKLEALANEAAMDFQSVRNANIFVRIYTPTIRCLIIGSSPIAVALSELAACTGFETDFYAPDLEAVPPLPRAVKIHSLIPRGRFRADPWTAAILAFHDHEQELPVFSELLRSSCFFIGAIGSRNAQAARKLALTDAGFSDTEILRVKSPAGLVAGLKTAPFVALSILTQVVATARELRIVS